MPSLHHALASLATPPSSLALSLQALPTFLELCLHTLKPCPPSTNFIYHLPRFTSLHSTHTPQSITPFTTQKPRIFSLCLLSWKIDLDIGGFTSESLHYGWIFISLFFFADSGMPKYLRGIPRVVHTDTATSTQIAYLKQNRNSKKSSAIQYTP